MFHIQPRKLSIDFALYTDGDGGLKQELVAMMIQNLRELDLALASAIQVPDRLKKTIHKLVPTISMINDSQFSEVLQIPAKIAAKLQALPAELNRFRIYCQEIIKSLEHELEIVFVRAN